MTDVWGEKSARAWNFGDHVIQKVGMKCCQNSHD